MWTQCQGLFPEPWKKSIQVGNGNSLSAFSSAVDPLLPGSNALCRCKVDTQKVAVKWMREWMTRKVLPYVSSIGLLNQSVFLIKLDPLAIGYIYHFKSVLNIWVIWDLFSVRKMSRTFTHHEHRCIDSFLFLSMVKLIICVYFCHLIKCASSQIYGKISIWNVLLLKLWENFPSVYRFAFLWRTNTTLCIYFAIFWLLGKLSEFL